MADKKVTGLTELIGPPADDDMIYLADVSDTTMAVSGTSKKNQGKNYLRTNGTANTLGANIAANGYSFTGAGTVDAAVMRAPNYYGGTASGGTATLSSTTHATKGKILLGAASAYDEANKRLGINTLAPDYGLHIAGDNSATFAIVKLQNTQANGRSWWLYSGAAGIAQNFGIYDQNAGSYRMTIDSNGYTQFVNIGEAWANVTFNTGWGDYGGSYQTAQYKKFGDLVIIRGLVVRSSGSSTTIFTLPVGYRPPAFIVTPIVSNDAFGYITVGTSGNVILSIGSPTVWVSLSTIVFSTL